MHRSRLVTTIGVGLALAGLLIAPSAQVGQDLRPVMQLDTNDPQRPQQWHLGDVDKAGIRALDAWDPSWDFLGHEDSHVVVRSNDYRGVAVTNNGALLSRPIHADPSEPFRGYREWRFGQYGQDWRTGMLEGDAACKLDSFVGRDPARSARKICEADFGWGGTTKENGFISLDLQPGDAYWSRGGRPGNWTYLKLTNRSLSCLPQVYGRVNDGTTFWCQVELDTGKSRVLGRGGDTFTLQRDTAVAYGWLGKSVYAWLKAGTYPCINDTFKRTTLTDQFDGNPDPSSNERLCRAVYTRGGGVKIAVLSTGVTPTADFLLPENTPNTRRMRGYNFVTNDANVLDTMPSTCPHSQTGLRMASVIGAETNNALLIAGAAPLVQVVESVVSTTCLALGNDLAKPADMADAILWSAGYQPNRPVAKSPAAGVRIIVTESGGRGPCPVPVRQAVAQANAAGLVVISGVGVVSSSESSKSTWPANCPGAVGVMGLGRNGERARWAWGGSNWGTDASVSAPGGEILALKGAQSSGYNWGDELAAAVTAAEAAVMWGAAPDLNGNRIRARLALALAKNPSCPLAECPGGMVNMDAALESALAPRSEAEPNDDPYDATYIGAADELQASLDDKLIGPADPTNQFCFNRTCSDGGSGLPRQLLDQDFYEVRLRPGDHIVASVHGLEGCIDCLVELDAQDGQHVMGKIGDSIILSNRNGLSTEWVRIHVHRTGAFRPPTNNRYALIVIFQSPTARY